MPFCVNCGNENPADARFCSKCGKEQVATLISCPNCGKELEANEKFCSACGTPVKERAFSKPKPEPQIPPKPKEEKWTKEGRKIISGGPKTTDAKKATTIPAPPPIKFKKKKKGCRGCAVTTIIIVAIFIVGTMLLYNKVSDWWQDLDMNQETENMLDTEGVDGIVDIESGDVSHLPENREKKSANTKIQPQTSTTIQAKAKETAEMKAACKNVENAFSGADIEQLKTLLTEQSRLNYKSISADIQPFMKSYAKAFKKRKLELCTENYALYSFKDEKGKRYTIEFAMVENGVWKLVRF